MEKLKTLRYEATVVTGLEKIAIGECLEKFPIQKVTLEQGKIAFASEFNKELLGLRSIDNLYVIIVDKNIDSLPTNSNELLTILECLMNECDWEAGLSVWSEMCSFDKCSVQKMLDKIEDKERLKPIFRVTCNRRGEDSFFTSNDAASCFGGIINNTFHWPVKMRDFDLEIVLNIREKRWLVELALTQKSLHHRNLVSFGATSLRSTICYNMLRLANIHKGDVLVDPMCGSGAIPVEASISWPEIFNIGGDLSTRGLAHARENVDSVGGFIDLIKFDVKCLPFKTSSVDVFVTDLPFGKRIGSKRENRKLYPRVFKETARCSKLGVGRAVFLTQDRRNIDISSSDPEIKKYWSKTKSCFINLGGLHAVINIFKRTNIPFV